ncbi:AraC family transcriptional regulator [bacterium]|nr:MAG: AraC family transcriptional regulator [bacterium]
MNFPYPPPSSPPPPPLSEEWVLDEDYIQLSASRPVRMLQHVEATSFRRHSHAFTELVMIQEGSIGHETFDGDGRQQTLEVQGGDFLVIPPGLVHGYGEGHSCRRMDICYLAEWFLWDLNLLWTEGLVPLFFASHLFRRAENLQIWRFRLSQQEIATCERELHDISCEYLEATPSLLFIRSTFFKILVILARAWRRQTVQGDLHFRPEIWRALQSVDSCIKDGRNFRIDAFAHDVGLAPKSFSRLFHAATGLSPSEYFGRRRTQHAAHLLLESDLSIGAIAARLGYCDSAHRSRAFLQNESISPRTFRSRYRLTD